MLEVNQVMEDLEIRMKKSINVLNYKFNSVRSGSLSSEFIENLMVNYCDATKYLKDISHITVINANTLLVRPFDQLYIKDVEKSIIYFLPDSYLSNDGVAISIRLPDLTEDRRIESLKLVGKISEDSRVAVRNIRRSGITSIRIMERNKDLSQDESRRVQCKIQELSDIYIGCIDSIRNKKEKEVMED